MNYTTHKVDGQALMFAITTTHNDAEITFNVVCVNDESEVPALVAHHLAFLDAPPVVNVQPQPTVDVNALVQQQAALIESLTARIAALEAA